MNDMQVSIVGNVVSELRFIVTDSGVPLASFRMVNKPRRFDRATASWVDGEPNHFVVNCWRTLAENVGSSISRGDPVVVTGRLRMRSWQRDENTRIMNAEIDAVSVGHDLRWGTTAFHRVRRGEGPAGQPPAVPVPLPGASAGAAEDAVPQGTPAEEVVQHDAPVAAGGAPAAVGDAPPHAETAPTPSVREGDERAA